MKHKDGNRMGQQMGPTKGVKGFCFFAVKGGTEQHLRAHKAVHLNKQGYVLPLWAQ